MVKNLEILGTSFSPLFSRLSISFLQQITTPLISNQKSHGILKFIWFSRLDLQLFSFVFINLLEKLSSWLCYLIISCSWYEFGDKLARIIVWGERKSWSINRIENRGGNIQKTTPLFERIWYWCVCIYNFFDIFSRN